jgi:hypothetical protein
MEQKVQAAATIKVAAVIGIKVKAAMTLAGFSQAELKDSAMQMRVRRMADKMRMKAPPITVCVDPSPASSMVPTASLNQSTSLITPTIVRELLPRQVPFYQIPFYRQVPVGRHVPDRNELTKSYSNHVGNCSSRYYSKERIYRKDWMSNRPRRGRRTNPERVLCKGINMTQKRA